MLKIELMGSFGVGCGRWVDKIVDKLKTRAIESQEKELAGEGELDDEYECPVCELALDYILCVCI